jgi:acetolactate synthase I/II/III large subunit
MKSGKTLKLSDYVANFLSKQGILHVFVVSGGASAHLIDSIAKKDGMNYICAQHEQAGAMAADAYSRVTGNLGAAIATSGPGAINMLTGVCGAYYDSVPVIYITGQVARFRMKGNLGVRQIGFQETDTIDIFRHVTKYAVCVNDPTNIRYELEKACCLARSGRPGPVLIDIPDDVQREQVDPTKLASFVPEQELDDSDYIKKQVDLCVRLLHNAKRPIIILGWGIRLAKAEKETEELISNLGFPVVTTWAVADLLPTSHPLSVGTFGTHGTRYANFAVQNADLIFSIGSRLDTKATGSPMTSFARAAKKIILDIDCSELSKFQKFKMKTTLLIHSDAKKFLGMLNLKRDIKKSSRGRQISNWLEQIKIWKQKYPICTSKYYAEEEINPYVFIKTLSSCCDKDSIIVVDTGCTLAWTMQAFEFKSNQRIYHDWNNTAMGWALPASIGACFASERRPVICLVGDGSLQMNIQELSTIIYHRLPIKIFLINNKGYSMIRQTQDQWFNSDYEASTTESGLAFPDFVKIAQAYGYETITLNRNNELAKGVREVLDSDQAFFCNLEISPEYRVAPQVTFGRPNEDMEPLLDREEFKANMIIDMEE